jgi:biopolymer transport protein ExbD
MKIPRLKLEASVPAVAMGDIAFLLLIFLFILARTNDTSHIRWKPATSPTVKSTSVAVAEVAIDADRKLFLNGRSIGVANLAIELTGILGDRPAGQRSVHLKVDVQTPAQYFEPAIEAISSAGGEVVHILEEEKPAP